MGDATLALPLPLLLLALGAGLAGDGEAAAEAEEASVEEHLAVREETRAWGVLRKKKKREEGEIRTSKRARAFIVLLIPHLYGI